MCVTITLAPAVAAWMRPRVDLTALPADLRERAEPFLRGEAGLPYEDAAAVSKAAHIPVAEFLAETPPQEDHPLLLGWESFPPRSAVETLYAMLRRQDAAADMLRSFSERPSWAAVHDPDAPLVLPPDAALMDLVRLLEETGVLIMMDDTVDGDADWPLDPQDVSMLALYDNYAPLVFLNSRAEDKERLLLRAYAALCWRADDLASARRPTKLEAMTRGFVDAFARGIPDGPLPEEPYLSPQYWELIRYSYDTGGVQATEAGRLTGRSWAEALDRFDVMRSGAHCAEEKTSFG